MQLQPPCLQLGIPAPSHCSGLRTRDKGREVRLYSLKAVDEYTRKPLLGSRDGLRNEDSLIRVYRARWERLKVVTECKSAQFAVVAVQTGQTRHPHPTVAHKGLSSKWSHCCWRRMMTLSTDEC